MLKYVKGDLLSVTSGIIAHGCNCKGAFGSGVAGQIARLYPEVRQYYFERYEKIGWELGDVQFVFLNPSTFGYDLTIANVASQDDYGTDKVNVDYSGLARGLETVFRYAEKFNLVVSLPKIGCGLAGGTWETVERIITTLLMKYPIAVTIYEKD